MHAIILAAGQGKRLAERNPDGRPKCLLELIGNLLDNACKYGGGQVRLMAHALTADDPLVGYACR